MGKSHEDLDDKRRNISVCVYFSRKEYLFLKEMAESRHKTMAEILRTDFFDANQEE